MYTDKILFHLKDFQNVLPQWNLIFTFLEQKQFIFNNSC